MKIQTFFRVFGFVVATASFLVGLAIILGWILPAYIPENFRIVVGIVMVLYGVYRTAMLLIKKGSTFESEK
jgi:hypothetical protein